MRSEIPEDTLRYLKADMESVSDGHTEVKQVWSAERVGRNGELMPYAVTAG